MRRQSRFQQKPSEPKTLSAALLSCRTQEAAPWKRPANDASLVTDGMADVSSIKQSMGLLKTAVEASSG